jgi:hypothetical protein
MHFIRSLTLHGFCPYKHHKIHVIPCYTISQVSRSLLPKPASPDADSSKSLNSRQKHVTPRCNPIGLENQSGFASNSDCTTKFGPIIALPGTVGTRNCSLFPWGNRLQIPRQKADLQTNRLFRPPSRSWSEPAVAPHHAQFGSLRAPGGLRATSG